MLRWRSSTPAEVETDRSPIRTPVADSMNFTLMSVGAASNSRLASSLTNFTLRSAPRRIEATPEATSTLTMLVMAGDADSTGKGRMGALGNGSSAVASLLRLVCADGAAGADEVAAAGAASG